MFSSILDEMLRASQIDSRFGSQLLALTLAIQSQHNRGLRMQALEFSGALELDFGTARQGASFDPVV
jgi:hypothetical protein